jgi:hypothetical protein
MKGRLAHKMTHGNYAQVIHYVLIIIILSSCNPPPKQDKIKISTQVISYREPDTLPGKTIIEKLSHVSQIDLLNETKWDDYRCGACAAINCYLLMGGSWQKFCNKFELPVALTFKNIHRLQDTLFLHAGGNKEGMLTAYYPKWDAAGKYAGYVIAPNNRGSLLFENMEMYGAPLLSHDSNNFKNRKNQVLDYFSKNPNGALFIGAYEDVKSRLTFGAKDTSINSENHYVTAFNRGGKYYVLDTYQLPGHNTLRELSDKQADDLFFNSFDTVVTLYFK